MIKSLVLLSNTIRDTPSEAVVKLYWVRTCRYFNLENCLNKVVFLYLLND